MLQQVIEAFDLLDSARITGSKVCERIEQRGIEDVSVKTVKGEKGATDFIRIEVAGTQGKSSGGNAPTLGIIGRLGGIGARPEVLGIVSDADGAIAAVAVSLKLADMKRNEDLLAGDVIICTHICPDAPTQPHDPVPFMGSPVDMAVMNRYEVDPKMDAILSIDATKGNRIANFRGFAISPTVKDGWILRVSDDLLDIVQIVTGQKPQVLPINMQDITPYGNGIHHINSILQPSVATQAPVVGIAVTTEVPVPGCASGANQLVDLEQVVRFCIEVAKQFGRSKLRFYDSDEFQSLVRLYGSMEHLQRGGK